MRIRLRGAPRSRFCLVDRDAGIVVSPVNDAERIDLGRPSVGVEGLCVRFVAVGEDFVDGDVLPRLRLLDEFAIVVAPPGRDIAAERAPFITGAAARPRRHVVDPDLDHVARLRVLDMDRAGADVHAEPFAGAAAEDRGVDRAGAAPVDGLSVLVQRKTSSAAASPRIISSGSSEACWVSVSISTLSPERISRTGRSERLK